MVKIFIDGRELEVVAGTTIFNAAAEADIAIPHLCYHPAFEPEGTCRMCLVEIEGVPKLELACATIVRDGMQISTRSAKVVEARKGVLEFLLAEHPLDCPICDKAGDCKLQDYYEKYGLFESRYFEQKDKHDKKTDLGKNLVHDQERCVLCRRCARFLQEITGTGEIGVFERGGHTEVNVLEESPVANDYSGNLAQLCPVGAITDRDFRFKTRNWFLEKGDSICSLCSRGCNITLEHHRGFSRFPLPKRVYRVKARPNENVNRHWICDLGRYGYTYLDEARLTALKSKNGGSRLDEAAAVTLMTNRIMRHKHMHRSERITLILNSGLTNEELFLAKKIFREDLGVENIYFADPAPEKGDDFLLTSDRIPNTRGARELGFELMPVDKEKVAVTTDLLLIFGTFLLDHLGVPDITSMLDKVSTAFLFSAKSTALDDLVDLVIPVTYTAEKAGSLTNVDGRVQSFHPALLSPGNSRAEWQWLKDLGQEMAIRSEFYLDMTSPESVFREMAKEIPFFEKHSE